MLSHVQLFEPLPSLIPDSLGYMYKTISAQASSEHSGTLPSNRLP